VIGFYITVGTSTLQMNVSSSEEKVETNIVLRVQLQVPGPGVAAGVVLCPLAR